MLSMVLGIIIYLPCLILSCDVMEYSPLNPRLQTQQTMHTHTHTHKIKVHPSVIIVETLPHAFQKTSLTLSTPCLLTCLPTKLQKS